jgi:hypothetical protein
VGHRQLGGAPEAVRQIHRHPAGQATRERGDDDLLPAGELADRVDGVGLDNLAVGLRAGLVEPGQLLLLQAPFGAQKGMSMNGEL